MQNAIGRNITLSIMKTELGLMFEEEAFVLPNSFEEDDIDIFAELGVVNNLPLAAKPGQDFQNENLAILLSNDNEVKHEEESQATPAARREGVDL